MEGSQAPALLRARPIWVVIGPAGCGKSTVGQRLASYLGNLPYLEGDDFHPKTNVEKMRRGEPLRDADRWDWLTRLREQSLKELRSGAKGVVVACSALKRKYRDVLRVAPYFSPGVVVHFIYLHASEDVLLERVGLRQGHYMGANMVRSQFATLEPPTPDEVDVTSIDVSGPIDGVLGLAMGRVRHKIIQLNQMAVSGEDDSDGIVQP